MTSTPATPTITFEQDANGRWRIYADDAPVHTVGRRIGQFRTRKEAEAYAASRFPLKPC